jgi:hypothetical protein
MLNISAVWGVLLLKCCSSLQTSPV